MKIASVLVLFLVSINCYADSFLKNLFKKEYPYEKIAELIIESNREHNILTPERLLNHQFREIIDDFEKHNTDYEWLNTRVNSIEAYPFLNKEDYADIDLKFITALNLFVEKYGNSAIPYLLRSSYYFAKGTELRGSESFNSTSYYQLSLMNFYLKKSINDAYKALSHDDTLIPAYINLMYAKSFSSKFGSYQRELIIVETLDPDNYAAWNFRVNKAQTKWSGDPTLLNKELNLLKNLIASNSNLIDHLQFKERIDANNYFYRKNYLHAEKIYSQLYFSGNRHKYLLINYARTLYKLKKKAQACEIAQQALDKVPFSYQANLLKAKCADFRKNNN